MNAQVDSRPKELGFQESVDRKVTRSAHLGLSARSSLLVLALLMVVPFAHSQAYSPTGAMTTARYYQTSTLLPNGSVLVAGGCAAGSDCLSSAEIYNPTTGTFTKTTGAMTSKRWGHTATLLPNGLVLITGGCTGGGDCLNSAELYNPATGTFSATSNMSVPRYQHEASLLDNGMVLITGGCQASSDCNSTAELYNPNTGLFTTTGSMEAKRWDHTSTVLGNGEVLIAGGCTGNGMCLNTAELYNPVTGTFSPTGNMTIARYMHTASVLQNGNVLLAGGCTGNGSCNATAELYNPTNGTFAATGSMSVARYAGTAANLFDGTVLISGGCKSSDNCTATAEIYNPTSATFALTGSMSSKRYNDAATLLVNGQVLTTGGCTGGGTCLASADLYNGPAPVYGYVSPKYVILSIQYAPPGSKSSVVYGNSTVTGTSTSFSSSFSNKQTESISYAFSVGGIFGIFGDEPNASYSATFTNGYTQEQDSSSSISINTTDSYTSTIPGPSSDYVGVSHSADTISVWLNPVLYFGTLPSNPNTLQLLGNTFDLDDPASESGQLDVVTLNLAQWLNPSTIDPATLQTLARTWEFNLEDGSSPGLTDADFADIASADPFSNPNYNPDFTPEQCSSDGRFCPAPLTSGAPDINYNQPAPGDQPKPATWGQAFQVMSTESNGYKDTHTVGYSLDVNLSNGFLADWANSKVDLKDSDTLTWTNGFSSTSTNTTNQTASVSVTPPACVVPQGGTTCNPVYTGPTEFDLYEDTVYRSFMFWPVN